MLIGSYIYIPDSDLEKGLLTAALFYGIIPKTEHKSYDKK